MDLPKKKFHFESGLNQRDRATGGFVGVYTHRKPGKIFYWRGFTQRPPRATRTARTAVSRNQPPTKGSRTLRHPVLLLPVAIVADGARAEARHASGGPSRERRPVTRGGLPRAAATRTSGGTRPGARARRGAARSRRSAPPSAAARHASIRRRRSRRRRHRPRRPRRRRRRRPRGRSARRQTRRSVRAAVFARGRTSPSPEPRAHVPESPTIRRRRVKPPPRTVPRVARRAKNRDPQRGISPDRLPRRPSPPLATRRPRCTMVRFSLRVGGERERSHDDRARASARARRKDPLPPPRFPPARARCGLDATGGRLGAARYGCSPLAAHLGQHLGGPLGARQREDDEVVAAERLVDLRRRAVPRRAVGWFGRQTKPKHTERASERIGRAHDTTRQTRGRERGRGGTSENDVSATRRSGGVRPPAPCGG